MTTQVIIRSPRPNHQDVQVQVIATQAGQVVVEHRLTEGEEGHYYVYKGQDLVIKEIAKLPPETPAE